MTAVDRPVLGGDSAEDARWWRAGLLVVIVVGLAIRVAYVLFVVGDDPPQGDAIYYSAQAETITRGTWFEHPYFGETAADHPPVTALVLALASFGGGDPLFEQRLLMTVIGVLGVAAIAHLGRAVGGVRVGLVAGGLAAIYPGLWINDGLAMSESPTALVTALLLLVAIRWHRGESSAWLVGAVGGIAILTRAELGLLLGLLVLPVFFGRKVGSWTTRSRQVGAVVVAAMVVVAPWTIRNLVRFEEPTFISTNDGLTLIGANCPSTYYDAVGFWDLRCAPEVEGDQSEVSARYRSLAIDYATDNLDRIPVVVVARVGRVWGVHQPMAMVAINQGEGRPPTASRLAIWGWWLLAPVAAAGLVITARRRGPWWVLLAPAVAVTATAILTYGIPRFRVPAEVALLAAAAVAMVAIVDRLSGSPAADAVGDAPPRHQRQRLDDDLA